jgi:hypothetical protein
MPLVHSWFECENIPLSPEMSNNKKIHMGVSEEIVQKVETIHCHSYPYRNLSHIRGLMSGFDNPMASMREPLFLLWA